MSTKTLLRVGLITSISMAGLTLTAQAGDRYGDVYDYERGHNCGETCVPAMPAAPEATRYGAPEVAPVEAAPVYIDCAQAGACAPAPVPYQQPAQTYGQAIACPAGTTVQANGTCMQNGGYTGTTGYTGATGYTAGPVTMGAPVNCPTGTTAQDNGTCLQTGSLGTTSVISSGTTSYTSGSVSGGTVACPTGTKAQSDGTCLQTGETVDLTDSTKTTTGSGYSWQSDGSYGSSTYLPTRK